MKGNEISNKKENNDKYYIVRTERCYFNSIKKYSSYQIYKKRLLWKDKKMNIIVKTFNDYWPYSPKDFTWRYDYELSISIIKINTFYDIRLVNAILELIKNPIIIYYKGVKIKVIIDFQYWEKHEEIKYWYVIWEFNYKFQTASEDLEKVKAAIDKEQMSKYCKKEIIK